MPGKKERKPRTIAMDASSEQPGILFLARPGTSSKLLADYLNEKRFTVWTTNDDIVAFDLFVRHGVEIEWLLIEDDFLDSVGERFLQRFHRHFPGVRTCLLTADRFGATARQLLERGAIVVPKPVALRRLVHTLGTRGYSSSSLTMDLARGWASESALERHSWSGS